MNFWMNAAMERPAGGAQNESPMSQLLTTKPVGEHSLVKAMSFRKISVDKGEHGRCSLKGQHLSWPAPLAEVFDPTGTGDTFAGGCQFI